MANDPPSQQPGGPPPEEMPDETAADTPASSAAPPPMSDYPQSGTAGGYTVPMSSSEYPPAQETPMQPAQGGYTPPPPGGYTPPPGGGYSAPPPPPPPTFGGPGSAGSTGGMDSAGLQSLFQSYISAVTKPNAGTYEGEMRNASWTKVLIGVAAVAVVGALASLVNGAASTAMFDQLQSQLGSQNSNVDFGQYRNFAGGGGPVGAFIGPFITFFLGSGLLFLTAKLFGGQGGDFLTHSYLLSLSYTPLRVAASALSIIPCVGSIAGLVFAIYQLYSAGLAMQASQRMAPGRAQMAAFLPAIVGLVLLCLCVVLSIAGLAAMFAGSGNR